MAVCTPHGFILYISATLPISTSEIIMLKFIEKEIADILNQSGGKDCDVGILDKGFKANSVHLKLLQNHFKPKGIPLPGWKLFENALLSHERGNLLLLHFNINKNRCY